MTKFTDSHTRLNLVYFLSKKNEAIDALITCIRDVVIPTGHRLQPLRSDRVGENRLQTGTKQEFAPTNTSQHNRISERERASLSNTISCFLAESGVPKFIWQEAFHMPVYLANRVPSTPLGEKHLTQCGVVEHLHRVSNYEPSVRERLCIKSDTSKCEL